jgi:hypothetical protein
VFFSTKKNATIVPFEIEFYSEFLISTKQKVTIIVGQVTYFVAAADNKPLCLHEFHNFLQSTYLVKF